MCIITAAVVGTSLGVSSGVASAIAVGANVALGASVVASLAGTGVSIAAQQAQAKAAEDQADYEAALAETEAVYAKQRGDVEQIRYGINARREFGKRLAAAGASNFDPGFGSTSAILTETRRFQAFDSDLIARSTRAEVVGLFTQAESARARGSSAASAARFASAGAGLSGAAQVAQIGIQGLSLGASMRRLTTYSPGEAA